jgi:FAD/FMN-containing dehydrogenase
MKIIENVTVDLRALKGISLNLDKTVVNVHAGETWSLVQEELEKYGLTLLGSRSQVTFRISSSGSC